MIGAIEELMTADHVRLDSLLRRAERKDGTIDAGTYAAFRGGLLRHIAMEEKVLIPFARAQRQGEPLAVARALREDHALIAKMLVPTPDRALCDTLRTLLARHNALEEGRAGLYAACDALAGDGAGEIVERLRAQPAVPLARHYDGPLLRHQDRIVAARVSHDHAMIRVLLDLVERACTAAQQRHAGGLESFRTAVWDLYIAFDEHLAMEEADVAPILRGAGPLGEVRAVEMILEHNEQRRVMLELVEDTECDAKDVDALVAEALALLHAFRIDMTLEDRSIGAAFAGRAADRARTGGLPR